MSKKSMTIHDVARELGVSSSTVSRAISGKGRIGSATRERILRYIEEEDYHPNASAQSLANAQTCNIALLLPEVKTLAEMPFFQSCMYAVGETAQINNYDMLVVNGNGRDTASLERLIRNRKVDGVILTRTYRKDSYTELLKKSGMPFVTIGLSQDEDVIQIDHDNRDACRELTAILLQKGYERIAYLGGSMYQQVNYNRYSGYEKAIRTAGRQVDSGLVFQELDGRSQIETAVDILVEKKVDCILCQDDVICDVALHKLAEKKVMIPGEIKIASCHYSRLLDNYPIGITSLRFDIEELGKTACKTLLDKINGKEVPKKQLLDYEVILKESTK